MKHFALILAGLLLAFSAPASAQVAPEVKQAEAYLNSLKTLQAEFIQTSSLGARLSGTFYLNRPGKLRFDYNEVEDFIVADGVFVYFYDSQIGSQTNAPIGQTLADFLLRKNLSLTGDLKVVKSFTKDGYAYITVVQSDNPAAGQVELEFSQVPYELKRWRITDAQGQITEVTLKNIRTGVTFKDPNLFGYHDPKGRKRVND